jgi:hypothetical protein
VIEATGAGVGDGVGEDTGAGVGDGVGLGDDSSIDFPGLLGGANRLINV